MPTLCSHLEELLGLLEVQEKAPQADSSGLLYFQMCLQLATALASDVSMSSLHISFSCCDRALIAIAEGVRRNTMLQSFSIDLRNNSPEAVVALAAAIGGNRTLQSFSIHLGDCDSNNVGNEAVVALAAAIGANRTLQSFSIDLGYNNVGNEAVVSLAAAIGGNRTLQSFSVDLADSSDMVQAALTSSLNNNFALQIIDVRHDRKLCCEGFDLTVRRNRELRWQCRVLVQLARWSEENGFRSLVKTSFRLRVMSFFLPPGAEDLFVPAKAVNPEPEVRTQEAAVPQCPVSQHATPQCAVLQEGAGAEVDRVEPQDQGGTEVEKAQGQDQCEAEQIFEAIRQSKDEAPLSMDGVVLYSLKKYSRTEEVTHLLLESGALAEYRKRTVDAGCEVSPKWAHGAKLFVPCTEQILDELQAMDLKLAGHHILALSSDRRGIEAAIKSLPNNRRPKLKVQHGSTNAVASQSSGKQPEADVLEVEHAFATDSSYGFPEWSGR